MYFLFLFCFKNFINIVVKILSFVNVCGPISQISKIANFQNCKIVYVENKNFVLACLQKQYFFLDRNVSQNYEPFLPLLF